MNLDPTLLAIIVCPDCHGAARDPCGEELVCPACGLAYPVRDDIPVLLVDEARRPGVRQPAMTTWFDESRLDDERALRAQRRRPAPAGRVRRPGPPGGPRRGRRRCAAAIARSRDQERPRAVVAAGPDSRLLRAVLEPWCPVPFVAWPAAGLPGWAGAMDLVVVLAPDGADPGTAVRRRRGRPPRLPGGGGLPAGRRWWPTTPPAAGPRCCRRSPATSWRPPW